MKTIIILLICAVAAIIFSSCNKDLCRECEKNTGTGNFRLVQDWTKIWDGIEKPKELDVYFYPSSLPFFHDKIYTDTTYYSLTPGLYKIIAVHNANAETYTGMDDYNTAQIALPVEYINSQVTTIEAPLCFGTHTTVTVGNTSSESKIMPELFVKIIHFSFRIQSSVEVTSIRAELQGVQTSVMLSGGQAYGEATLPFVALHEANNYYKTLSLFGFAPGSVNLLTTKITFRDGSVQETVTDLTGKFDFHSSPIQRCTLTYNLNDCSVPDIKIENWRPGHDNEFEIY